MTTRFVRKWSVVSCGALLGLALCAAGPARADDGGISVSGVGVSKGKPTVVEIGARVTGEGELAADASVKFNDAKKKAMAALDGLKNADLTVEPTGPSIGVATDPQAQMRMMQGMAGEAGKQKVQISEQLRLQLKGVDKIEPDKLVASVLKIIDTAKDAGLQVGPPPGNYFQMQIRAQMGNTGDGIVVFKIPDKSQIEGQAYEKAVADARAKAERLAALSGVKLGRVLSVTDEATAAAPSSPQSMIAMIYGGASSAATPNDSKEVENSSLGEIAVTVRVMVKFEIK